MSNLQLKIHGLNDAQVFEFIFNEVIPRYRIVSREVVKFTRLPKNQKKLLKTNPNIEFRRIERFVCDVIDEMDNPMELYNIYVNNYLEVLSRDPTPSKFDELFYKFFVNLYWIQKLSEHSDLVSVFQFIIHTEWWRVLNRNYNAAKQRQFRMKHPEEVRSYFRATYNKRMQDPVKKAYRAKSLKDAKIKRLSLLSDEERQVLREKNSTRVRNKRMITKILES